MEAQRCGIPVLVRREETIPPYVTYAAMNCGDIEEIAYQALLTDPLYHHKVSQAGIEYAQ